MVFIKSLEFVNSCQTKEQGSNICSNKNENILEDGTPISPDEKSFNI